MEKELLIELIEKNLSIWKISKELNKSYTSVRYWMNKYGLKSNFKSFKEKDPIIYGEFKYCPKCKKECKITDFYKRDRDNLPMTYCKKCAREKVLERIIIFKSKCVEYKGGKCIVCGYNRYYGALEFHHLDPSLKDFSIAKLSCCSFNDIVKIELDKCVLLCANCHREVERKIIELTEFQKFGLINKID